MCAIDFGASVIRVDKPNQPPLDVMARYDMVFAIKFNALVVKLMQ